MQVFRSIDSGSVEGFPKDVQVAESQVCQDDVFKISIFHHPMQLGDKLHLIPSSSNIIFLTLLVIIKRFLFLLTLGGKHHQGFSLNLDGRIGVFVLYLELCVRSHKPLPHCRT